MTPSATDASSKLIIGIDIGTRLSAVSYLLTRNGTPSGPIQHVKRWPGITATAQNQGGTTVPSLMYYGEDNRIKYGYDAEDEKHAAGYDSRRLVREFKRAVHRLGTNNVSVAAGSAFDQALQESDAGITLRDVYTDWLRFLMQQAKPQIEQRYSRSAGREWVTVWSERIVVLVIPNGWGIPEQATLRGALVDASFISVGTNARFVVESEVALYSAKGLKQFKPKKGEDFMVCDVGAATTDLALYTVLSENPLQVQEVKDHPSISIEAGLALAEEQTDEGNYVADDNDLGSFADDSVSPDDPSEAKDAALNKALDEQFSKIVQAIKGMIGQRQPKYLILGGGLPTFQSQTVASAISEHCGMSPLLLHHNIAKNANGAIECFLSHVVQARASPFAYGNDRLVEYKVSEPAHQGRKIIKSPYGNYLNFGWKEVIPFGAILDNNGVNGVTYYRLFRQMPDLSEVKISIYGLNQRSGDHLFIYDKSEKKLMPGFVHVCTLNVDLSDLQDKLQSLRTTGGQKLYKVEFTVKMAFQSSALHAWVSWNGPKGEETSPLVNIEEPDSWEDDAKGLLRKAQYNSPPSLPHGTTTGLPSSPQGRLLTAESDGSYVLAAVSTAKVAQISQGRDSSISLNYRNYTFYQKWIISSQGEPPNTVTTIRCSDDNPSRQGWFVAHPKNPRESRIFIEQGTTLNYWRLYEVEPDIFVIASVVGSYVWTAHEDNYIKLESRHVDGGSESQRWRLHKP